MESDSSKIESSHTKLQAILLIINEIDDNNSQSFLNNSICHFN